MLNINVKNYKEKLTNIAAHEKQCFQGGRLKQFMSEWMSLTSDKEILNAINGYEIELTDIPWQMKKPKPITFTVKEENVISKEIAELLRKGVIEKTENESNDFVSKIFVREKKHGSAYRMILDLSKLNDVVQYRHFKMDTLKSAINMMTPNCYMASIDIASAYYHVPIAQQHKKLLKFEWEGKLYQFVALPNGLCSGPRVYTKLMKPCYSMLRNEGYCSTSYIDDNYLQGVDKNECIQNVIETAKLLLKLGFVIHPEKSQFEPSQKLVYLGFILDSQKMTVKVTPEKAAKIKQKCKLLHGKANPSIRQVAKVIGTLVSACQGVKHGPLYFRQLENEKIVALKNHKGNFDAKMTISEKGRADLAWWITHIDESDKPVALPAPDIILESDASLSGWGGYNTTRGVNCGGEWLPQDLLASAGINDLEMRAVFSDIESILFRNDSYTCEDFN